MASPDISVETLLTSEIIPRLERFVNSPVNQKAEMSIVNRPRGQSLGFAVCRVIIAESCGVANASKTLVPPDFAPGAPDDIVPETLDLWFSYASVAVHIASRIEQGTKPYIPWREYYDPKDPIRPSSSAIEMLRWRHDPRNFTTLMAVDSTGRALVDYIVQSRAEPFRMEGVNLNPAVPAPNVINRVVELGAYRFNKYLDYWVVGK